MTPKPYLCAEVSADAGTGAETGTLIFILSGTNGTFRREIIFRLVGEPRIVFPNDTEDGTGWDLNAEIDTVKMVAGMGGKDSLRFVFLDAVNEPSDITFAGTYGFEIKPVKDKEYAYTYYAEITNKTKKIEKEAGIFAKTERRDITVNAVFPDGTTVSNYFFIKLYPDELWVPLEDMKEKVLEVDTVPDEDVGEGFSKIKPTGFSIFICYTDTDDKAVILENPSLKFGRLDDGGRYGKIFSENFQYNISRPGSAGFNLYPGVTLPMTDPYEVVLPVTYKDESLYFYRKIPIKVLGETPTPPGKIEWAVEYERLKKSIAYFGIGGDPQLRELIRNADLHSADELKYTRRYVIQAGIAFYSEVGDSYRNLDRLYTNAIVVSGALVKCGDYAVGYLLKVWLGPELGSIGEKIANPLKNLLATYIGTYIANGTLKDAPNFFKTLLDISADIISDTLSTCKPDTDSFCLLIACSLLVSFSQHFFYGERGEKGDVIKSCIAMISDLALEKIKDYFLKALAECADNLLSEIGNYCGNLYKGFFSSDVQKAVKNAGDRAFQDKIRREIKNTDGITSTVYSEALKLKSDAAKDEVNYQIKKLDSEGRAVRRIAANGMKTVADWMADSPLIGQILNYMLGGKKDDNDALGLTASEVIKGYLSDRWGLEISKVFDKGVEFITNPYDLEFRFSDGNLILGILGCEAVIPVSQNIAIFGNWMFDSFFKFMDDFWKNPTKYPDPNNIPDPRDDTQENLKTIEDNRDRVLDLKPITYKYKK